MYVFCENDLAHKVGWASCPTRPFWKEQTDPASRDPSYEEEVPNQFPTGLGSLNLQ